jgi:choline dehydrogenase-like flavoprotein
VSSNRVELVGFFEQAPNRDSRVMLDDTRHDALGLRLVRVDWRFTELDRHTHRVLGALTGHRLALACSGRFDAAEWTTAPDAPSDVHGTAHHMGTTRMAENATHGVVDTQGKVHGVANLHVAGSSVFPTGGWAFPTFTLIALSLRLAEQLRALLALTESSL